jgi:hypothetical protein
LGVEAVSGSDAQAGRASLRPATSVHGTIPGAVSPLRWCRSRATFVPQAAVNHGHEAVVTVTEVHPDQRSRVSVQVKGSRV